MLHQDLLRQKDKTSIYITHRNGNTKCFAHVECDAIIKDKACVQAIPEITANHLEANLIHEAAIGKIAGEQLIKLMSLGLSEKEAEQRNYKWIFKINIGSIFY